MAPGIHPVFTVSRNVGQAIPDLAPVTSRACGFVESRCRAGREKAGWFTAVIPLVENGNPVARPVRKAGVSSREMAWLPKQNAAGAIAGITPLIPLRRVP
jgi:hypothetical protein